MTERLTPRKNVTRSEVGILYLRFLTHQDKVTNTDLQQKVKDKVEISLSGRKWVRM